MYNNYQFEFGTQDGTGAPLNIAQGQCIINISLSCLYHDFKQPDPPAPPIQPQTLLPDPIPLDFYFVQRAIREVFDFQRNTHNIVAFPFYVSC